MLENLNIGEASIHSDVMIKMDNETGSVAKNDNEDMKQISFADQKEGIEVLKEAVAKNQGLKMKRNFSKTRTVEGNALMVKLEE